MQKNVFVKIYKKYLRFTQDFKIKHLKQKKYKKKYKIIFQIKTVVKLTRIQLKNQVNVVL